VTAASAEGAKRAALDAERVTGNKSKRLRDLSAERRWAVGRQTQRALFDNTLDRGARQGSWGAARHR
jgi:hypothetical protein